MKSCGLDQAKPEASSTHILLVKFREEGQDFHYHHGQNKSNNNQSGKYPYLMSQILKKSYLCKKDFWVGIDHKLDCQVMISLQMTKFSFVQQEKNESRRRFVAFIFERESRDKVAAIVAVAWSRDLSRYV